MTGDFLRWNYTGTGATGIGARGDDRPPPHHPAKTGNTEKGTGATGTVLHLPASSPPMPHHFPQVFGHPDQDGRCHPAGER